MNSPARARKTLALARFGRPASANTWEVRDERPSPWAKSAPIPELRGLDAVLTRRAVPLGDAPPDLAFRRRALSLKDIFLDFPGQRFPNDSMHSAIRELDAGDELNVRPANSTWELTTTEGRPVGRLAQTYRPQGKVQSARVHAVIHRRREDSAPEFQARLRCDEWEVVIPELVFT